MSSFQINLSSEFENRLLPNDLFIVRNHGDDEEDVGEEFGGVVDELEAQSKSSSSLLRSPGAARTKINAQATTESVLDALYMDGKKISRSFQWN